MHFVRCADPSGSKSRGCTNLQRHGNSVLDLGHVRLFFCPPLAIVGLILGIKALRQIKKSGGTLQGRGLAIAGTVLSAVFVLISLVIALVMLIVAMQQNGGPTEAPSAPRPASTESSPSQPSSTRPTLVQQLTGLVSKDVPDAPCPNNLKQIEEALKKFANKHRGLWPAIDGRQSQALPITRWNRTVSHNRYQ